LGFSLSDHFFDSRIILIVFFFKGPSFDITHCFWRVCFTLVPRPDSGQQQTNKERNKQTKLEFVSTLWAHVLPGRVAWLLFPSCHSGQKSGDCPSGAAYPTRSLAPCSIDMDAAKKREKISGKIPSEMPV